MSTKRVPVGRSPATQITDAALAAFEAMRRLETQCTCPEREYGDPYVAPCKACDEWWAQHSILHHEIGAKLWEWPAIEHPASENPWPEGSAMWEKWQPDEAGRERYRLLEQALRSRRAQAKRQSADDRAGDQPTPPPE